MEDNNSNIKVEFGAITIDKVEASIYDANQFQAQIRQVVTKTYKKSGSDSLSDSLFKSDEFGDGQAYNETRVTWIAVPREKATVAAVQAQLVQFPQARIMRFLGLKPILSNEQLRSMESGVNTKTLEQYGNDQSIPNVNYKGYAVTRVVKFVTKAVEDIDNREKDYVEMTGDVTEIANTATFQMGRGVATPVNAVTEQF